MIEETLKKIGMTENEAKLYVVLLKEGASASGKIIKKTGFQSSVVYHLLNTLIEKGFVSFVTQNKKKLFSATDPKLLEDFIKLKEQEIINLKKNFKLALNEMYNLKNSNKEEQKITIYTGVKGIQTIFNDLLDNSKEYWNYSTRDTFGKVMPKYREYFRQMRINKKIKQKMIIADDKRKPNRPYQEKRYVPKEFSSPIGIQGYNDKVIIFIWDSEPPIALMLEGKKVSKVFKDIFETMWKSSNK